MHRPFPGYSLGGRGQGLAQHLPPEDVSEPQVLAFAPEDVLLDLFQFEDRQQFGEPVARLIAFQFHALFIEIHTCLPFQGP